MKSIQKLFTLSLAVLSISTLITTVTGLIGIQLPAWALRTIGVVNLISLPLLIYSTVKDMKARAEAAGKSAKKTAAKADDAEAPAPAGEAPRKVQPRPHPQALAAKKAAAGNKPKKGKKKKK